VYNYKKNNKILEPLLDSVYGRENGLAETCALSVPEKKFIKNMKKVIIFSEFIKRHR
jgi:hypothetical protein